MTVSASIGLWAATPNINVDHNYVFNLDLTKPYRDFKGKYGKLGFDPKGRILFIGKSRNDDVWLAMAPWSFFDDSADNMPAGHVTGDARLSTKHYRMLVMFFAYLLSQLPDRGFTCIDKYGIHLSDSDPCFFIYTNILYVSFSFISSTSSQLFPPLLLHLLPFFLSSCLPIFLGGPCSFYFTGKTTCKLTCACAMLRLSMTTWNNFG